MDNDASSSSDEWSNSLTMAQKIVIATIMSVCSTGIILLCSYMFFQAFTECKRRRRRREYLAGMAELQQQQRMGVPTDSGLGREDLEAMPVFIYTAATRRGEGRPECAVCLGEFGEGEKGKVLPICRHTFHKECIDMWLCSNTTCPLCRSNVKS